MGERRTINEERREARAAGATLRSMLAAALVTTAVAGLSKPGFAVGDGGITRATLATIARLAEDIAPLGAVAAPLASGACRRMRRYILEAPGRRQGVSLRPGRRRAGNLRAPWGEFKGPLGGPKPPNLLAHSGA